MSRVSRSVPRRASLLAAALLLGAGAVAGCQSNPKPPPLGSTAKSTSTAPTPSPALAAPTLPAEAKGASEAAAKAFVRHYVAALNYSAATGDTEPVRELSGPECLACNGALESIESVYGAHGSMQGDGWSVRTVKYQPLQPRLRPVLTVGIDIAPQRVITRKTTKTFQGGKRTMTFFLVRKQEAWIVSQLEQAS